MKSTCTIINARKYSVDRPLPPVSNMSSAPKNRRNEYKYFCDCLLKRAVVSLNIRPERIHFIFGLNRSPAVFYEFILLFGLAEIEYYFQLTLSITMYQLARGQRRKCRCQSPYPMDTINIICQKYCRNFVSFCEKLPEPSALKIFLWRIGAISYSALMETARSLCAGATNG